MPAMKLSTIGVLGGGQLGRMMASAAHNLGMRIAVLDPDRNAAAGQVADRHVLGDFRDPERIRELAVGKYGLRDGDILFDPLVLPIITGIEADRRNALETIEGTRLISKALPDCHTVVGLSTVSFGLKPAARVEPDVADEPRERVETAEIEAALERPERLQGLRRAGPDQAAGFFKRKVDVTVGGRT